MVVYTGASLYQQPLRPRIKIYAFSDTTYSSPLYSYDPFTDAGSVNKPVALHFESLTTNAGTFSLEVEDKDSLLDPDLFMRGNRVAIDCSKDGITYNPAFRGLVRSSDQNIYGINGRNLVLSGYSYLIRLSERLLNIVKQSAIVSGSFDRTDSTMFTNNLVNDLLTNDADYIYSSDDTALYSVLKTANIIGSPIADWIPKLDAQFVTVANAIDNVLEFSNSLVMVDFSTDQLMLYNPQQVTSATQIFLLTNQMNQLADDADITMYPLQAYKYNVSYDYPDSGSRLIISLKSPNTTSGTAGSGNCPAVPESTPDSLLQIWTNADYLHQSGSYYAFACQFTPSGAPLSKLRLGLTCQGNMSGKTSTTVQIRTNVSTAPGSIVSGGTITMYKNDPTTGEPTVGTAFPSSTTNAFAVGMLPNTTGPSLALDGTTFWMCLVDGSGMTDTQRIGWIQNGTGNSAFSTNGGSSWTNILNSGSGPWDRFDYASAGQAACGGVPSTPAILKDVFAVAHDRSASGRIGIVEKVLSSLPTYIIDLQTSNEYLFNKLYVAGKPRFTFDFPNVSMPNKLPKAGDIVCHVDRLANVGLKTSPVQTGIISQIIYDFAQGSDSVLGLRKLSLSTTGVRRGYY
jgi:hypothetical protein